ncbi:Homeobox and C2H2 transcription factor, putative [Penicillium digitatum PHI26]|uniref:Homeobox and C2H2 transcription factor, putative n=2 Tax=Penicillium digitatum TaxID=36651 RepID=K9G3A7_PEND2|nr:Homeobox and C2H2 transcription factor, putative [Penicillium digitatum Pd1]EKV04160.1 Homeobox and C2H2 transcription factor, putative [Penicillium digitatum Pd1]EKV16470.1 Homeobox and C2H2 transcription factor, putative [Penicillium digitatum PHI26]
MEYFDFEGASSAHDSNQLGDDVASTDIELDEAEEQTANFHSLVHDQTLDFPTESAPEQSEVNVSQATDPVGVDGVYPMFRAQEPCDYFRLRGLDCFVAKRAPGKFLQTLHSVSENAYVPTGSLTGKIALKSFSYNTYPNDPDLRSQKSGARFSRKATSILKGWPRDHNENPYPTEQEREKLKQHSGLTRTQIANWLANARRRGKVRSSPGGSSPVPGAVYIPMKESVNISLMTPLERWKYSPPENEPATISDITRALANPPFDPSRPRGAPSSHRHEKSMHLILDKWTCSPHGGTIEQNGIPLCVFCLAASPDDEHLETHNFISCQEKAVQERTFYRKDHLNQHLRLMHNAKFQPCMEKWQSSITDIKSRCGFCGSVFQKWKDRVDHLAGHFKNGASMAQWQGDWGFDPQIQARVENAIPPYMIDYEWRSPDPWATEQAKGDGTALGLPVPTDINCYHRLSRELTTYIHDQKAQGRVPSDQMIQAEARRVIYGCDDPWNQTCADNIVWLSVLKRDCGLQTTVNNDSIQFADLGMQPPFAINGGLRAAPREINTLARTVFQGAPVHSPAISNPSLRGHGFPGTGFSSAGPSRPGSLSGSYAGSAGMVSAGPDLSFSDWASSLPTTESAPGESTADSLVQMGFDPEFLQRLNDSYGEINPDDLEGLHLDRADGQKSPEEQGWPNKDLLGPPTASSLLGDVSASDPVALLNSKVGHPPASNATHDDTPGYFGNRKF